MINVFDYTDYKKYLGDYLEWARKKNPDLTYQALGGKAGFNNRGFAFNVFKGNKKISRENCCKLSRAMEHNRYEAEFFENLVAFNQSEGYLEKEHFYNRMLHIKRPYGKKNSPIQVICRDQYEFYSKWHHAAVRSILGMYPFKDDYKWLGQMISPPITPRQARLSVELLLKLGLVVKNKGGTYRLASKGITTGQEVVSLAVTKHHLESTELAKKALLGIPRTKRNFTGLTLGISDASYEQVVSETQAFQERLMKLANDDSEADRVYQFNFHLFPVSKADTK